jgi:non-ribosomal peptide synthetase component E (peptide arylation enzyme)
MNREGRDELVVPYPPHDVARYREAGIWGTRTIMQEMRRIVDEHPDALALITQEQHLTYAELDQRADLMAAGLLELGLQPGEPALLQCTNTAEAIIAWYGLLKAGLVPVCTPAIIGIFSIFIYFSLFSFSGLIADFVKDGVLDCKRYSHCCVGLPHFYFVPTSLCRR